MEEVRERLLRRGDYIWGSWTKPERVDGYIVGVNPGDRTDTLGRFPFSEASVDDAIDCANRGLVTWRRVGRVDRSKAIRKFRDLLQKNGDRHAALISRETGKPVWETKQEVSAAIRAVDLLLEDGLALLEPRILHEREARSDYRPRGVVGILVPYNTPLMIATLHACAALLAGNTGVIKPSKFTPGVGQSIAELFDKCKLPRGVVNLVQGSGSSIGARIAAHPGIDSLLFSGSYGTATEIRRATVDRPELPVMFQCGGKGAALVIDGCDLDRAVYETLLGAFLTAGQRQNSTGRAIVTEKAYGPFVEELVRRAKRLRVGYGFEPHTFMGPVISENFRTRYRRYGRALVQRGHEALLEARNREVQGHRGFYVDPAVYAVKWDTGNGFINDEPAGPTLLVYKVRDWEEGVALHNRLMYRLSTSLFVANDNPDLPEIVGRLKTGSLNINRTTISASLRLPSVGLGRSSNGVVGGIDLVRFLSTPRCTLVETRPFDASQVAPGTNWEDDDDPISVEVEIENI